MMSPHSQPMHSTPILECSPSILRKGRSSDTIYPMSSRARAITLAGGILTAILLAGLSGWTVVNSRDMVASGWPDLAPDMLTVPYQDNAFVHLRKASALLQWPHDTLGVGVESFGEEWDDTVAGDVLYRNSGVFSLVEQGLACSAYRACDASGAPAPQMESWDRLSTLLAQKAAYEWRMGVRDAACEDSCGLLRLGFWITSHPRSLVEWQCGMMAVELGLEGVARRVHEPELGEAELVALLDRLNRIDTLDRGLAEAFRREFQDVNQAIDTCARRFPRRSLRAAHRFQPNRTREACASIYRRLILNVPRVYAEVRLPQVSALRMGGVNHYLSLLRPNRQGRMMEASFLRRASADACFAHKCRIRSDLDGLRLVIACRLYEARQGRRPEQLDALTPEFLPRVPCDPFDGKPFRYVRERALVYSVGMDLKDSEGVAKPPLARTPVQPTREPPDEQDWPEYPLPDRRPLLRGTQHGTGDMVYRILPEGE